MSKTSKPFITPASQRPVFYEVRACARFGQEQGTFEVEVKRILWYGLRETKEFHYCIADYNLSELGKYSSSFKTESELFKFLRGARIIWRIKKDFNSFVKPSLQEAMAYAEKDHQLRDRKANCRWLEYDVLSSLSQTEMDKLVMAGRVTRTIGEAKWKPETKAELKREADKAKMESVIAPPQEDWEPDFD